MIKNELFPEKLRYENLMVYLRTLQTGLRTDSELVRKPEDVNISNIDVAVTEFLDLVEFSASQEKKDYLFNRFIKLKSVEKILYEFDKYLSIDFNWSEPDMESENYKDLAKTHYQPRILKYTIKRLTIPVNNFSADFEEIILNAFNQLLYFLEYEYSIEEIIYNIKTQLEPIIIMADVISVKIWAVGFDANYFTDNPIFIVADPPTDPIVAARKVSTNEYTGKENLEYEEWSVFGKDYLKANGGWAGINPSSRPGIKLDPPNGGGQTSF